MVTRLSESALSVLTHLEMDARTSYAALGRRLHISREQIHQTVKRFEASGIINGYMTFINSARLGLTSYVVYGQLNRIKDEKRQELLRKLGQRPEVYWISSMGGKFDILFGITAPHALDFNRSYLEIQELFGTCLSHTSINTRLRTIQFPRNYLTTNSPRRETTAPSKVLYWGPHTTPVSVDTYDREILNLLSKDPQMTNSSVGDLVKLNRMTVDKRIKRLEKTGVIQGYCAKVHAEALGYEIFRILLTLSDRSSKAINSLYSTARKCDYVTYFDHGFGAWDVEITCEVKNQKVLQSLLQAFRNDHQECIESVDILPVFVDNVKFQFTV